MRLPEIGEAGQERLARANVALGGDGLARIVEERYLRACGVGIGDGDPLPVDASVLGIANPAAHAVGEGALRALVAMRSVLGVGS